MVDYQQWDKNIESAIAGLPEDTNFSRAQSFLRAFPTGLSTFRAKVEAEEFSTTLPIPLAEWQKHPTFLLRFAIAEWQEEQSGKPRTVLEQILNLSLNRIHETQEWRSGKGDNWIQWGYKDMDSFYSSYTTPTEERSSIDKWFLQLFYGRDKSGRPVHYELLPNTYHEELIQSIIKRRIINNEHTLRNRMIEYNSIEGPYEDPILGVTWVLDARELSMWSYNSMYKTMSNMLNYSKQYTSRHYPEQGYRALVVNLGSVLITLYNLAMKVMPASTRSTTSCHGDNDILDKVIGWDNVPMMFRNNTKQNNLTEQENSNLQQLPWNK